MDDFIKERLEFLKLEYQQIGNKLQHLENMEWRIRQFSITLWLVALGVGLGVITEGVDPDFNILIISGTIPIVFLFFDAWLYKWMSRYKARAMQIEQFISNRDYILPRIKRKIAFKQFCTNRKKTFDFPVLDLKGTSTFGGDKNYAIKTGSYLPYMKSGLRVLFYHFQLIGSLVIISLQSYKLNHLLIVFLIIGISPSLHFSLVILSKIREARIRSRAE